jgi:hypothetical protein|tara:strand:- start:457 stop:582 length:126 start_codon:yes stop_codon:yes gene_type:complete
VVQDGSTARIAREKKLTRDVFMVTPLNILGVIALVKNYLLA